MAQSTTTRGRRATASLHRTGPGRTAVKSRGRTPAAGRFARQPAPSRTLRMRRKPQQSGLQKAMSSVLPMLTAKKATPSSKKGKAGGAALLAAAAAGAGALLRRRRSNSGDDSMPPRSNSGDDNMPPPAV